jgi:hypothetical protein
MVYWQAMPRRSSRFLHPVSLGGGSIAASVHYMGYRKRVRALEKRFNGA